MSEDKAKQKDKKKQLQAHYFSCTEMMHIMLQKDYKVFMPLELRDGVVRLKSDVEIEGSTGADHTRTTYESYRNHN